MREFLGARQVVRRAIPRPGGFRHSPGLAPRFTSSAARFGHAREAEEEMIRVQVKRPALFLVAVTIHLLGQLANDMHARPS